MSSRASYRRPTVVVWPAYVGLLVLAVYLPLSRGLAVPPVIAVVAAALLTGGAVGWFDRRLGLAMFALAIGGVVVVAALDAPTAYQIAWILPAFVGLGLGRDLRYALAAPQQPRARTGSTHG